MVQSVENQIAVMADPITDMGTDRLSLPGVAARQRGSSMILAVTVIVAILLLTVAFMSSTQGYRITGQAVVAEASTESAVDQTIAYIGEVLAEDVREYLAGTAGYEIDHPGQDYWLASHEAIDTNGDPRLVWDEWQWISLVAGRDDKGTPNDLSDDTPELDFVNALTFLPQADSQVRRGTVGGATPFALILPSTPVNNPNIDSAHTQNLYADSDGDGFYDSRWIELPISTGDGYRWIAAIRITDNTGLVNVNTAKQFGNPATPASPPDNRGLNPADIDLLGLMINNDDPIWANQFDSLSTLADHWYEPNINQPDVIGFLRGEDPAPPAWTGVSDQRETIWEDHGRYITRMLGINSQTITSTVNVTEPQAFSWEDEIDLRLRFATNSSFRTSLEDAFEGSSAATAFQGALRSNTVNPQTGYEEHSETNPLDTTYTDIGLALADDQRLRIQADRRRLLTVHNGIRTNQISKWIENTTGHSNLFDLSQVSTSVRLNEFADLMSQHLQPSQLNSPPANPYPDHEERAYSMAANLGSMSDANGYGSGDAVATLSSGGSNKTFYGLEAQPFIVEATAYILAVEADSPSDPPSVYPVIDRSGEINQYLVIELRNPFPKSLDLINYEIHLKQAAATTVIELPSVTVDTGEHKLIVENDPMIRNSLADEGLDVADFVTPVSGTLGWGTTGTMSIELHRKDFPIAIDRLSTSSSWPSSLSPGIILPQENGTQLTRIYTSESVQRDHNATSFEGNTLGTVGVMPLYAYEDETKSMIQVTPDPNFGVRFRFDTDDSSDRFPLTDMVQEFNQTRSSNGITGIPEIQIPFRDEALETVGDLLVVPVVSHEDDGTTVTPFSEKMFDILSASAASYPKDFRMIHLRIDDYYRTNFPEIPAGMAALSSFDIVQNGITDNFISGLVNVNTAPIDVLTSLPYLQDNGFWTTAGVAPIGIEVANAIVGYRDFDTDGANFDFTGTAAATSRLDTVTVAGGYPGWVRRDANVDYGFSTASELLAVNSADAAHNIFREFLRAGNLVNAPDFTTDSVDTDIEERTVLFSRLSNLVTTRSDVFTAYVVLQGREYDNDLRNNGSASANNRGWVPAVERRFVMTMDRSNVTDTNGELPRVVMFVEE